MNTEMKRYGRLTAGLILYALGVIIMLKVNLGLSAWDVFNQGVNRTFGISIGSASIIVGSIVISVGFYFNQPIGLGTIIDIFLVGTFMDIFNLLLTDMSHFYFPAKIILFIIGLFICAYGCFMYIPQGLGCGPIDGLMVRLSKVLKCPIGVISISLEAFALVSGYFLGGTVGLGTVIATLLKGPFLQVIFKFKKVDIKSIHHRSIKDEFILLSRFLRF